MIISADIKKEHYEKIKEISIKEDRTISYIVRKILEKELSNYSDSKSSL